VTAAAPPIVGTALPLEYVAYEAYLAHQKRCGTCRTSLFVCSEGAELWEAFKVAVPPARVRSWATV
jgi:hypothetical protein